MNNKRNNVKKAIAEAPAMPVPVATDEEPTSTELKASYKRISTPRKSSKLRKSSVGRSEERDAPGVSPKVIMNSGSKDEMMGGIAKASPGSIFKPSRKR